MSSRQAVPWGVLDQVVSAVTNAVVVIASARTLEGDELGRLSIALSVAVIAINLSRCWTTQPLMIRYPAASDTQGVSATADALSAAMVLGVAGSVGMCVVGLNVGGTLGPPILVAASALVVLLVQDACRMAYFAAGRPLRALCSDAAWLVVSVAVYLASPWSLMSSAAGSLSVWAVSAVVGLLFALPGLRRPMELVGPRRGLSWLRRHSDLGRSLFGDAVLVTVYGLAVPLILAIVSTVDEAGSYRIALTAVGPVLVIVTGVALQALPRFAARAAQGAPAHPEATRLARRLGAVAAAYTIGLLVVPDRIMELAFGDNWAPARATTLVLGASVIATAVTSPLLLALRAHEAPTRILRVRLVMAPLHLLLVVCGAALWGASGAAAGLLVGNFAAVPVWWRVSSGVMHAPTNRLAPPDGASNP